MLLPHVQSVYVHILGGEREYTCWWVYLWVGALFKGDSRDSKREDMHDILFLDLLKQTVKPFHHGFKVLVTKGMIKILWQLHMLLKFN